MRNTFFDILLNTYDFFHSVTNTFGIEVMQNALQLYPIIFIHPSQNFTFNTFAPDKRIENMLGKFV